MDEQAQWWREDAQRLDELARELRDSGAVIDVRPTANAGDQPRDEAGRWVAAATRGEVSYDQIDASKLSKKDKGRAYEARGRFERGQQLGEMAREPPAAPVPVAPTPVAATPLTGRTPLDRTMELHDRAGRGATTLAQVSEHVQSLEGLPKEELRSIHLALGHASQPESRGMLLEQIEDKLNRKLAAR